MSVGQIIENAFSTLSRNTPGDGHVFAVRCVVLQQRFTQKRQPSIGMQFEKGVDGGCGGEEIRGVCGKSVETMNCAKIYR